MARTHRVVLVPEFGSSQSCFTCRSNTHTRVTAGPARRLTCSKCKLDVDRDVAAATNLQRIVYAFVGGRGKRPAYLCAPWMVKYNPFWSRVDWHSKRDDDGKPWSNGGADESDSEPEEDAKHAASPSPAVVGSDL